MKNFFTFYVFISLILVSCSSTSTEVSDDKNKNDEIIWKVRMNQSKIETEKILKDNHYEFQYTKDNTIVTSIPTINYLGVDWDYAGINFKNDSLKSITFMRLPYILNSSGISKGAPAINDEKIGEIINNISQVYGEERQNRRDAMEDEKVYIWYKDNMGIELRNFLNGDGLVLSYFEEGYNPMIELNRN